MLLKPRHAANEAPEALESAQRVLGSAEDSDACGGVFGLRRAAQQAVYGRAQLETKSFKDWFKNSQVVDAAGQPKVVYHGAQSLFTSMAPLSYFSEHYNEANGYALKGSGLETANAMARQFRFVPPDGLDIKDSYLIGEAWPCLDDFDGPDHVVFPVEDALAYRVKGRYYIVMDRHLDGSESVLDVRSKDLHPYERMQMVYQLPEFVRTGTSEMERSLRAEIAATAAAQSETFPVVMPVYLSMQNPFVTDNDTYAAQFIKMEVSPGSVPLVDVEKEVARLKALGHDGIIAPSDGVRLANVFGEGPGHDVLNYVVFDSCQVKSALGNCGSFDPHNPDLRK